MEGVQFIVDEKGRKTGVVIGLRKHGELWEARMTACWRISARTSRGNRCNR